MVMSKRGSTIFFMLMMGIVFFLLGLALAPALNESAQESMNSYLLNCSDSTISNQNKAICTSIDVMTPVYVGVIFGLAGMIIGGIGIR